MGVTQSLSPPAFLASAPLASVRPDRRPRTYWGGIVARLVATVSTVLAIFGLAYGGLAYLERSSSARILEAQRVSLGRTVEEVVRLHGATLERFVADYSLWNATAEFVAYPDPAWAEVNLDASLATFSLDGLWVYDAEGQLVYGTGALGALDPPELPFIAEALVDRPTLHHFAMLDDRIVEVRAARVQDERDRERTTPALGYLVAARIWSDAYLGELGRIVGGTVAIEDAGSEHHHDRSITTANFMLFDAAGSAVGFVCAEVESPIVASLEQFRGAATIVLVATAVLLLVVSAVAAQLAVVNPLRTLERGMKGERLDEIRELATHRHELGELARVVLENHRGERERARLAAEIAQASRLASLGVVSGTLAHELNNPLAVVLGYADLLVSQGPDDQADHSAYREAAKAILSQAERMRQVVERVRDLSFESDGSVCREPTDLGDLVHRGVEAIQRGATDVIWTVEIDERVPLFPCDPVLVESAVQNLAANARDAVRTMPVDQRAVVIRLRYVDPTVVIEVSDSGPGVSSAVLGEVFQPFVSTKGVGLGKGLGLAIVPTISRRHGGSVEFTRGELGGAKFTLELATGGDT
jgi:signal transduction histidine kinase